MSGSKPRSSTPPRWGGARAGLRHGHAAGLRHTTRTNLRLKNRREVVEAVGQKGTAGLLPGGDGVLVERDCLIQLALASGTE